MAERTYHEHEIAALLERAAERQAVAARRTQRPGLTLAELEQVAAEAGIDPAHLRAAAAELDDPGRPLVGRRSGTSATHNYVERWVPGELTPEAWEDVVAELRHRYDSALGSSFGMSGYGLSTTEQIGRTVEWRHVSMWGVETRVMVSPRDGQQRIRLSQRVGITGTPAEAAIYGFIPSVLGGLIAGSLAGSLPVAFIAGLLLFLVVFGLVFYHDRKWRGKKHRELEDLADMVAEALAQPEPAAQVAALGARTEPTLALPEEPAEAEKPAHARRHSRS